MRFRWKRKSWQAVPNPPNRCRETWKPRRKAIPGGNTHHPGLRNDAHLKPGMFCSHLFQHTIITGSPGHHSRVKCRIWVVQKLNFDIIGCLNVMLADVRVFGSQQEEARPWNAAWKSHKKRKWLRHSELEPPSAPSGDVCCWIRGSGTYSNWISRSLWDVNQQAFMSDLFQVFAVKDRLCLMGNANINRLFLIRSFLPLRLTSKPGQRGEAQNFPHVSFGYSAVFTARFSL